MAWGCLWKIKVLDNTACFLRIVFFEAKVQQAFFCLWLQFCGMNLHNYVQICRNRCKIEKLNNLWNRYFLERWQVCRYFPGT